MVGLMRKELHAPVLKSLQTMKMFSRGPEKKKGQFARFLRSFESARDHAQTKGKVIPSDKMRSVTRPPDPILRAYCDLLLHVFVFQRNVFGLKDLDKEEAHDLADAMHSIGQMFTDYGAHLDDETFRQGYLRPFDRHWANEGFGLEQFIESRLRRYSEAAG
jgi:hypothetical protein